MNRAFIYCRYSTDGQNETSIERQTKEATKWANRNNIPVAGVYVDRGISGTVTAMERKGFNDLMKSGIGEGDYLLIEKQDRLSREESIDALIVIREIQSKGIKIINFMEDNEIDISDRWARMAAFFKAEEDHERAVVDKKRSMAGKRIKMEKALYSGGEKATSSCPQWLTLNRETNLFEPISERVLVIKRMFELARFNGSTVIARTLNEENVPAWATFKKTLKNNKWYPTRIKEILKDRRLIGEFQPKGFEMVKGYYPAVIDEETFFVANKAMEARKISGGASYKNTVPNIARGLTECQHCSSNMHYINKGAKYSYLRCGDKCKQSKNVRYRDFEETLVEFCNLIPWDELIGVKSDSDLYFAELTKLDDNLKQLAETIEGLIDKVETTQSQSMMSRLETRLAEREAELKALEDQRVATEINYRVELAKEKHIDEVDFDALLEKIKSGDVGKRAELNSLLRERVDRIVVGEYFNRPAFVIYAGSYRQIVFIGEKNEFEWNVDQDGEYDEIVD